VRTKGAAELEELDAFRNQRGRYRRGSRLVRNRDEGRLESMVSMTARCVRGFALGERKMKP
jgi:hypothetical protein